MEGLMVLFGLALAGIAFLLPIVSFLLALGNQRRLRALEETVIRLQGQLNAQPAPAPTPVPTPAAALRPSPPQPVAAAPPPLPPALAGEQEHARSETEVLRPRAFWALMLGAACVLLGLIVHLVRGARVSEGS